MGWFSEAAILRLGEQGCMQLQWREWLGLLSQAQQALSPSTRQLPKVSSTWQCGCAWRGERARRWPMNLTNATFQPPPRAYCLQQHLEEVVCGQWGRTDGRGGSGLAQVGSCGGTAGQWLPWPPRKREPGLVHLLCLQAPSAYAAQDSTFPATAEHTAVKSFLRATILHLAKELCHLLELHLDLSHL